jgi:CheY-like chemotaxis protein
MAGEVLLNSWKEIARYVGRSERTVQRWEKQCGFPVRRPAGKTRSAVIALPSEIQGWSKNTPIQTGTPGAGSEGAGPPATVKEEAQLAPTLLCIDEHPEGLAVRKVLLEAMGYRVLAASSGRAGLRLFEKNHVDLVVLDYWISDVDGAALARMLQQLTPRVPILLLSGSAKNIPRTALQLTDSFVHKGQATQVLLSAIAELCCSAGPAHPGPGETAPAQNAKKGKPSVAGPV